MDARWFFARAINLLDLSTGPPGDITHTSGVLVSIYFLHICTGRIYWIALFATRKHEHLSAYYIRFVTTPGRYRAWIVIIRIRCWKTMKDTKKKLKRFVILYTRLCLVVDYHAIYSAYIEYLLWHCNFSWATRVLRHYWIVKYDLLSIIIVYRFL